MPRPSKKLTKQDLSEIEMMAGLGLTQQQIADIKGFCVETLVKHAQKAYKQGKAKAIAKVSKTAFDMATSGRQPTMTKFYLRTQAGWCEQYNIPEALKAYFEDRDS